MSAAPQAVFLLETCTVLPGSDIAGRFVVDVFEKPFSLTCADVELRGEEYSHVTLGTRENRIAMPNRHTHVNLRHTVYGVAKENAKKGSEVVLEPGHYEFPFCFQLPLDAPPTYGWDAYKCGSRVTYTLRGSLRVPHRQSVHLLQKLIVLPTVSFAQAQEAQQLVWSSKVQHVPVRRNHGLSKSKSEYMAVRLQLCPTVVVVGSPTAALYYREQRHAQERGDDSPMTTGHLLGATGYEEEDRSRSDSDSGSDSDSDSSGRRRKAVKKRFSLSARDVEPPPAYEEAERDGDDSSDKDVLDDGTDDDDDEEEEERAAAHYDAAVKPWEENVQVEEGPAVVPARLPDNAPPKKPLKGRLVRVYHLEEALATPFQPSTDTPAVVCVRVVVENFTKEPLRAFTVALRQLRETRVRKLHRTDKVTLSAVTVTLPAGDPCHIGETVTADVELPLRRGMHYEVTKQERRRGLTKAERRLPQPTLRTKYFCCETIVELSFPENALDKDKGQFAGCVQVVDVVGVPDTLHITVPAVFTKRIENLN